MAASSLLALLDDIATLLDDVAVLTKVAAKKTAGVLGDDLALNAQQVAGVRTERELPVVGAVAKGSLVNKAILVPAAIAISAIAPWLVTPLLMVGGAFLCFEGVEKLAHKWLHPAVEESAAHAALLAAVADPATDLVRFEQDKIKGAIRTDFILSAEIVAITLGAVRDVPLVTRIAVMVGISLVMTVGVYGLVAAIVKLDDLGVVLVRRAEAGGSRLQGLLGRGILRGAPYLMKALSVGGTLAMFLVGGGILAHGLPGVEPWLAGVAHRAGALGEALVPAIGGGLLGVVAGALLVALVTVGKKLLSRKRA
jgi:hypothetical protein